MWSEEMDKKIRAAAEKDVQGYDDNSWHKMNALLNKHLPVKKDRRRYLLLFVVLLIAIPGYFITKNYFSSGTHQPVTQQNNNSVTDKNTIQEKAQPGSPGASGITTNSTNTKTSTTLNTTDKEESIQQKNRIPGNENPVVQTTAPAVAAKQFNSQGKPLTEEDFVNIETKNARKGKKAKSVEPTAPASNQPADGDRAIIKPIVPDASQRKITTPAQQAPAPVDDKQKPTEIAATDQSVAKQPAAKMAPNKPVDGTETASNPPVTKKQTPKKSTGSRFSINLSAGPEITSVGLDRIGTWRMAYGVGFGYAITDRIGIRAGFYAGDKIYSADSTTYKTPYTSGGYNNKLSRIDADCYVYEIPVTVMYNFASSGKHNWFASTGLSTYLMKKEKYVYTYTGPWGQTVKYTHLHKNENSHYFSVLNLSGGYQYHINDRLSLLAEPYMKIPLTGVGAGKVKLNAGGMLFTLSVRPFGK
jgi:hypothetical protein